MEIVGIIYIICGILYMICCILDSPDIKPKWKKIIGLKLRNISNYFYKENIPQLNIHPLKVEQTTFNSLRLYNQTVMDELEIFHLGLNKEDVIKRLSKQCERNLLEQAKGYINFKMNEDYSLGNKIIVSGTLYIGEKNE